MTSLEGLLGTEKHWSSRSFSHLVTPSGGWASVFTHATPGIFLRDFGFLSWSKISSQGHLMETILVKEAQSACLIFS